MAGRPQPASWDGPKKLTSPELASLSLSYLDKLPFLKWLYDKALLTGHPFWKVGNSLCIPHNPKFTNHPRIAFPNLDIEKRNFDYGHEVRVKVDQKLVPREEQTVCAGRNTGPPVRKVPCSLVRGGGSPNRVDFTHFRYFSYHQGTEMQALCNSFILGLCKNPHVRFK